MCKAELYAAVKEMIADPDAAPSIRAAADFFAVRPAAFVDLLGRCEQNPSTDAEAAVALLSALFAVETQRATAEQKDPFRFDEVALLLSSCEGLAESVKATWSQLALSLASAAHALSMAPPRHVASSSQHKDFQAVVGAAGDAKLSTVMAQARLALTEMQETVHAFCTETSRLLRYNSVGGELRDVIHLLLRHDDLSKLQPGDFEMLTAAVCRELQCKLERVWYTEFQASLESSGLLPATTLQKLHHRWLTAWNLRKSMEQSSCFVALRNAKELIRKAAKPFPVTAKVSNSEMTFFFDEAEGRDGDSSGPAHSPALSPPLDHASRFEEMFIKQRLRSAKQSSLVVKMQPSLDSPSRRRQGHATALGEAAAVSPMAGSSRPLTHEQVLASRLRPRHVMHRTLHAVGLQPE